MLGNCLVTTYLFTPPSHQLRSEFAKAKSQAKWSDSKSLLCMSAYSEFDADCCNLCATCGCVAGNI